jgi:hypothetical protein
MHLKHLKKHLNTLKKVIEKHTENPDKTFTTYVSNIYNIHINTLAAYV